MKKRRSKTIFLALLLAIVFLLGTNAVYAETTLMNEEESKAYQSLNEANYIKARKESEDLLKENPHSFMANYVLSGVFLLGEGNLQRGLQYHKYAIRSFENAYGLVDGKPENEALRKWHQRLLFELADIYGELDDRSRQLAQLELVEDLYGINTDGRKVWALMKLFRMDEARALAEGFRLSTEEYTRFIAYNDLIAIEDSEYNYWDSYQIAKEGAEISKNSSCVILSNLSRAAVSLLKFNEAFEAIQLASKATDKDCPSNPDIMMIRHHIQSGKYQNAISLAKHVRSKPPSRRMRIQTEKEQRATFADLFYSMGYVEKAFDLMKTVVEAPDRQGYNSYSQEKYFLSIVIQYAKMLETYLQRLKEKRVLIKYLHNAEGAFSFASYKHYLQEMKNINEQIRQAEFSLWKMKQTTLFHVLNPDTLRGVMIPYHMIDNPNYQYGFFDTLGVATAEALLNFEEKVINEKELEAISPNSQAMRAYLAWKRKDTDILDILESATMNLPEEMQLFKLSLRLLVAQILYKDGKKKEAYAIYHQVLDKFPAAYRMMDVALPVAFAETSKSKAVYYTALLKSGRFKEDSDSFFEIKLHDEDVLSLCLVNTNGHRYRCSSKEEKDIGLEDSMRGVRIADQFLHAAFTPSVDLTQSDIHSLDGSPIRVGADKALDSLLE